MSEMDIDILGSDVSEMDIPVSDMSESDDLGFGISEADPVLDTSREETAGFRASDGSIIQPSDGRKSWDEPTPLDGFLKYCVKNGSPGPKDWMILKHWYKEAAEDQMKEVLENISSRETIAQFEAHRDKECLLVLGNCPQYNVGMPIFKSSTKNSKGSGLGSGRVESKAADQPTAFTIQVLGAIAEEFGPRVATIGLDVRKSCRKEHRDHPTREYSPCRAIRDPELHRLLWATKLELAIAERLYKIEWRYCFAFSTYPCQIASLLGFEAHNVVTTSFHIADCARPEILIYRKWKQAGMILKDITEALSKLPFYKGTEEHLYNKLAAAVRKWNPNLKMPGFDLKKESYTTETRADLMFRRQELLLKISVYDSVEIREDLDDCNSKLAKILPASTQLTSTTSLGERRKKATSRKHSVADYHLSPELQRLTESTPQLPHYAGIMTRLRGPFHTRTLAFHLHPNDSSMEPEEMFLAESTGRRYTHAGTAVSLDIPETKEHDKRMYKGDLQLEGGSKKQMWTLPKNFPQEITERLQSLNKRITLGPLKERLKFKPDPIDQEDYKALRSFCSSTEPNVLARSDYEPDPEVNRNIPLHLVAWLGLEELLEKFLQWAPYLGKDYVNARNYYEATPLHVGTYELSTAGFTMLLDYGADVNATNHHKESVLDLVLYKEDGERLRLLLERGTDPKGKVGKLRKILGRKYVTKLLEARAARS